MQSTIIITDLSVSNCPKLLIITWTNTVQLTKKVLSFPSIVVNKMWNSSVCWYTPTDWVVPLLLTCYWDSNCSINVAAGSFIRTPSTTTSESFLSLRTYLEKQQQHVPQTKLHNWRFFAQIQKASLYSTSLNKPDQQ